MSAKRKRVVLSMSQKLRIIERLDKGEKAVELSAEYSVGKSTIAAIINFCFVLLVTQTLHLTIAYKLYLEV